MLNKRLAVLGHPVSHSRSPAMHTAALDALGLAGEWSYEAIDVPVEEIIEFIAGMPGQGFVGANVTVPHKQAALIAADEATLAAREIGAANTLSFRDGLIHAANTDALAIAECLPYSPGGKKALVMGAGGSARAAVWALREAGAVVNVWNRTPSKAEALAAEFGVGLSTQDAELVVNSTTVGMGSASRGEPLGEPGDPNLKALPLFSDGIRAKVVIDLVYGSRETDLIMAARAAGAATVDGLEILVRQGAASLRAWTGAEPPLEVMMKAARGSS